jgi:uncharacterized protein (TIGR00255 family)
MPLQSMTGFSRVDGETETARWTWEIRSVNGKALDARLRLPSGLESIEIELRKKISKTFSRGNLQVAIQFDDTANKPVPQINENIAKELWQAAQNLHEKFGGDMPSIADLMTLKGVVEYEIPSLDEGEIAARNTALLNGFCEAVDQLQSVRLKEGAAISAILSKQIDAIEKLVDEINSNEDRSVTIIGERLKQQVDKLLNASEGLDTDRLHQEATLLAAKADVQEEIDRLNVHIQSARDMLAGNGPAGRRLDFLAQEFNRECNTICSKSNSAAVTTAGLDMKIVIDQFREQLQNLE